MEEQSPPEQVRFTANVKSLGTFVHKLVTIAWDKGVKAVNPSLAEMAKELLESFRGEDVIDTFIESSYCYWDLVKERKKEFFIEKAGIVFGPLPVNYESAYKMLFSTEGLLTEEDEEDLWEHFICMIKISIKYIHKNSEPFSIKSGSSITQVYGKPFMPFIDTRLIASKWGVPLDFPERT